MALATYSDLKSAVALWLHRSDLTSVVPDFVTMAEWRLARDLRVAPLLTTSNSTVTAASTTASLPTGYLEMMNVQISGGAELHYVPPDTIDRVSGTTTPWAYTIYGSTVVVAPSWTAGGTLVLTYFKKETALSDSNTTNWYITNAPDALLYACLLEAVPYLVADERVNVWAEYYAKSIKDLNRQYGNIDPIIRRASLSSGLGSTSEFKFSVPRAE